MTEAPERIWAYAGAFRMWREKYPEHVKSPVEYLRADHVDALLKAERDNALREAAEKAGEAAVNVLLRHEPDASALRRQTANQAAKTFILALISEDKTNG